MEGQETREDKGLGLQDIIIRELHPFREGYMLKKAEQLRQPDSVLPLARRMASYTIGLILEAYCFTKPAARMAVTGALTGVGLAGLGLGEYNSFAANGAVAGMMLGVVQYIFETSNFSPRDNPLSKSKRNRA